MNQSNHRRAKRESDKAAMKCEYCGKANQNNSQFCVECGTSLAVGSVSEISATGATAPMISERAILTPALCLMLSGVLSLLVLLPWIVRMEHPGRLLVLVGGSDLVLLIPVLLRGDPWQKMVAGILLFVASFGLLMSVMD